jgi:hypothetical protein
MSRDFYFIDQRDRNDSTPVIIPTTEQLYALDNVPLRTYDEIIAMCAKTAGYEYWNRYRGRMVKGVDY